MSVHGEWFDRMRVLVLLLRWFIFDPFVGKDSHVTNLYVQVYSRVLSSDGSDCPSPAGSAQTVCRPVVTQLSKTVVARLRRHWITVTWGCYSWI